MAEAKCKPHSVCIPFPYQGHIKPLLKFAKLLHHRGFLITFVNTEYNHRRFLKSLGPNSLDGICRIFNSKPSQIYGLSTNSDSESTEDLTALTASINKGFFLDSFRDILAELNKSTNPVTCIVVDGFMSFSINAANELGIPVVSFFPIAACGFIGFKHYRALLEKGLVPLKGMEELNFSMLACKRIVFKMLQIDEACLSNGYLDTVIDWIPGLRHIRLRDLPTFLRTTDPKDICFNLARHVRSRKSTQSFSSCTSHF